MPTKRLESKEVPVIQEGTDGVSDVDTTKGALVLKPNLSVETTSDDDDDNNKNESKETTPCSPNTTKENVSGNIAPGDETSSRVTKSTLVKQKSAMLSREASMRVDSEVNQLMRDICRIGSNPGEPSVTFGELFDDEDVQNTYEALVGTLRSAKRQGYINFKGQMLFKGVHDDVTINVVEGRSEAVA